ncbi:Crp/Fnr family transcriptional regulator [Gandjariella thermophila]|uniref:Crp/Fnr family transcriptional regulator n=1 Tax=Gandjariella thermophila TaxID=1931992 RepID=UPI001CEFA1C3|nr:Crp/Fnr family transcriptional regulator [Gandjariella thermophila]
MTGTRDAPGRAGTAPVPGSFLARLGPADREFLLDGGAVRRYSANTTVVHRGDPSDFVIFLVGGWAKVSTDARNGHEALLAIRGPGDVIGELAAIDGRPRSASVRTLTPVRATVLASARFLGRLRQRPDIAIALLGHVADRLRESDAHRLGFGAHTVPERLAAYLLDLAERHGVADGAGTVIDIPLSQRELAGAVGASREAAARFLRILRERRVIVTLRRRIVVVQPEVLRSISRSVHFDAERPC